MAYSVFVTDTSVTIGKLIKEELIASGIQVSSFDQSKLGKLDTSAIRSSIEAAAPDLIINTFGWSDTGEKLLDLPVVPVAQVVADYGVAAECCVLQLSNYRVFSGTKSGFLETDEICPRDKSGEIFTQLEQIAQTVERHIILRLSWVIGAADYNLMTSIARALWHCGDANIHAERRGAPVGHSDISRIITAIVKQVSCGSQNWGIFHYSSADVCTEEELAEEIRERLITERDQLGCINDISDAEAKPYSASLGYRRLMDNFGIQPRTWRQGLNVELNQWINHQLESTPLEASEAG